MLEEEARKRQGTRTDISPLIDESSKGETSPLMDTSRSDEQVGKIMQVRNTFLRIIYFWGRMGVLSNRRTKLKYQKEVERMKVDQKNSAQAHRYLYGWINGRC